MKKLGMLLMAVAMISFVSCANKSANADGKKCEKSEQCCCKGGDKAGEHKCDMAGGEHQCDKAGAGHECGKAGGEACAKEGKACMKDGKAAPAAKKTIVCRVYVKKGQESAFIKLAKTLTDATRKEAGNVSYNLYQSPFDASTFIFYEEYKDDAAFQVHANSVAFKTFADGIKPLLAKDLNIEQF